jgi:hypothetical protein
MAGWMKSKKAKIETEKTPSARRCFQRRAGRLLPLLIEQMRGSFSHAGLIDFSCLADE